MKGGPSGQTEPSDLRRLGEEEEEEGRKDQRCAHQGLVSPSPLTGGEEEAVDEESTTTRTEGRNITT